VLLETKSESGILKTAIIGFGVNVNMEEIPEEIQEEATSVYKELGQKVDRTQLLVNILYYLENLVSLIESDKENEIIELWKRYDTTLGKRVAIVSGDKRIEGIAQDLDDKGFLLVKTDDGKTKRVVTAESVRLLE